LVLVAWVYGACLERWELSADYEKITHVIRALPGVLNSLPASGDREAEDLRHLFVAQARCIEPAMRAENAMNCSCPVGMHSAATKVIARAAVVEDGLPIDGASPTGADEEILKGPRRLLRADVEAHLHCYQAVACLCRAMGALSIADMRFGQRGDGERRQGAVKQLDEAIAGLVHTRELLVQAAGAGNQPDRYASELAAHARSARALRNMAWAPRIHVNRLEVVYVYPFAFGWLPGERAVELAKRQPWKTFGIPPSGRIATETPRTDMWEPTGAGATVHEMWSVRLADICVETNAYTPGPSSDWPCDDLANEKFTLKSELRFDRLGNHYLRVSGMFTNVTLHTLNQVLRRGSRDMGRERLVLEGCVVRYGDQPRTLVGYATSVIVAAERELQSRHEKDDSRPHRADEKVIDPAGDFHIVLSLSGLSICDPRRALPANDVPTLSELGSAAGAGLLFSPVAQMATSLEDWARYPMPEPVNLLGDVGYADDFAIRTANTSVICLHDAPFWLTDEVRDAAEFVASQVALLKVWNLQALSCARELSTTLDDVHDRDGTANDKLEGELRRKEIEARRKEARIHLDLARIHARELVRTRPQREFLNALWAASDLPDLEGDVEAHFQAILPDHERLSAIISNIVEKEHKQFADRIQMFGLVIGAFAIAGVLAWLDDVIWHHDVGNYVVVEAAVYIVVVLVMCVVILSRSWRRPVSSPPPRYPESKSRSEASE